MNERAGCNRREPAPLHLDGQAARPHSSSHPAGVIPGGPSPSLAFVGDQPAQTDWAGVVAEDGFLADFALPTVPAGPSRWLGRLIATVCSFTGDLRRPHIDRESWAERSRASWSMVST